MRSSFLAKRTSSISIVSLFFMATVVSVCLSCDSAPAATYGSSEQVESTAKAINELYYERKIQQCQSCHDYSQALLLTDTLTHLYREEDKTMLLVNLQLTRAHLYQLGGRYREASRCYSEFIEQKESLNTVALSKMSLEQRLFKDVIQAQLSAGDMERKLAESQNSTLSVTTIALNTIGALLLVLLIYCIHSHHRLHEYNNRLKRALSKADEGVRVKDNFMNHISSQIRLPLNLIIRFSNKLHDMHPENEEVHEYLDVIKDSGSKLDDIISGILNVSKLQSEIVQEDFTVHKVNALMNNIVSEFSPKVHPGVEIRYRSSLSNSFSMPMRYHAAHLLIDTLISNAVKYTEKGTISLEVSFDDSKSAVILVIEDTGVGISDEAADKIFNLFFKENGYELGAGAGLFIAKQVVEGRKGSLHLDESYKDGARFILSVPIEVKV